MLVSPGNACGFNLCQDIAAVRNLRFGSTWVRNPDGVTQKHFATFTDGEGNEVARMPMYCWQEGEGLSCVDLQDIERLVVLRFPAE